MTNSPKVLGISGSPRRKANTETLVTEILAGAEEAGALTTLAVLDELDIRPCKGCFACSKTHECVQQDDLNHLVTQMQQSAIWVLGTPIYWWGPSSQFKAFVDRWVSIPRASFRSKPVILAIPMGGGSESFARHTLAMFEDIFQYLDMNHMGTVLAPGSNSRDAVHSSPGLMKKAHQLGKSTVQEL